MDIVKNASTIFASSNVLIQALMSGSLSLLWGLINSLQIVAHYPLLVINYPENAKIYSEMLLALAKFDLIPEEWLIEPTRKLLGVEYDEEQIEIVQSNLSEQTQD